MSTWYFFSGLGNGFAEILPNSRTHMHVGPPHIYLITNHTLKMFIYWHDQLKITKLEYISGGANIILEVDYTLSLNKKMVKTYV